MLNVDPTVSRREWTFVSSSSIYRSPNYLPTQGRHDSHNPGTWFWPHLNETAEWSDWADGEPNNYGHEVELSNCDIYQGELMGELDKDGCKCNSVLTAFGKLSPRDVRCTPI